MNFLKMMSESQKYYYTDNKMMYPITLSLFHHFSFRLNLCIRKCKRGIMRHCYVYAKIYHICKGKYSNKST